MFTHLTGKALESALRANAEPRAAALARHLDDAVTVDDKLAHDLFSFDTSDGEYMVLTGAEADEMARKRIGESLWAFNTSFLSRFVPALRDERARKAWERMVGELCEDATPLVEALLGDKLEDFFEAAISADGRGHFLASYDAAEHEVTVDEVRWYIYRTN